MHWVAGAQPNFQARILAPRVYQFQHPAHGTLVMARAAKAAAATLINFALQLTPPGGAAPINAFCHVAVMNNDPVAHSPARIGQRGPAIAGGAGTSSVGYGDIDISNVGGRGIIYLVHRVFASTGGQLGVAMFVVESIVNPALDHVCQNFGMRWAVLPNAWQGACATVEQRAWASAQHHGWA